MSEYIKSQFPSFKVFIYGLEVTNDATSITITASDGKYPDTAAITLQNNFDKYIFTMTDMLNTIQSGPTDKIVTPAGPLPLPQTFDVPDEDKSRVIKQKLTANVTTVTAENPREAYPINFESAAPAYRYPFQVGKPIFHPNDPIRIALRDEADPNVWYWAFAGFMSDFTDSVTPNQARTVTIVGESVSKLLRYARFTSNPGIADINSLMVKTLNGDIQSRTAMANVFIGATLPQMMFAMLFGISAFDEASGGAIQSTDSNIYVTSSVLHHDVVYAWGGGSLQYFKSGIGHIRLNDPTTPLAGRSTVFEYGDGISSSHDGDVPQQLESRSINNLEEYQMAIDTMVIMDDLVNMAAPSTSPIHALPNDTITQIIEYIGRHPEIYPIDGGRLMMLIPKGLGVGNREIVTRDLMSGSYAMNTEWITRAQLIFDMVDRIEFVMYTTGKGDFCVEFPLVDFKPADFGKYANRYVIGNQDISNIDSAFIDAKVATQVIGIRTPVKNRSEVFVTPLMRTTGNTKVTTLWHLIPMYGVRQIPITTKGYISSFDGVEIYNHISLNRTNADAYTQKLNMNPRFSAQINRPYYIQYRNHIGTTRNYSHNITWGVGGSVTSNLNFSSMRGWAGDIDIETGDMIFTPIGGWSSRPYGYDIMNNRGAAERVGRPPGDLYVDTEYDSTH